jgi:hypothetical protein
MKCGYTHRDASYHLDQRYCGTPMPKSQETNRELWESINGSGSWAFNPFVWALSLGVHQINVDALIEQRRAA